MSKLLYIETATKVCSVALSEKGKLIAFRESLHAYSHAELLTTFMEESIKEVSWNYDNLDAIVVSKGPGSYTGLRIGVSSAKGLCFSLEKPLIAVSTLQAMAFGMAKLIGATDEKVLFCPMIDARRMEVYSAIFDKENNEMRKIEAEIIDENSFSDYLKDHIVYFAGDGAEKCKESFSNQANARFLDDFQISSKDMIEIATQKFEKKLFEDVAYFEPYYLKDFVAGPPRVKGLK
jgi:tRNA threonylcarbamoyladenosine biosynthesis protein TsaB